MRRNKVPYGEDQATVYQSHFPSIKAFRKKAWRLVFPCKYLIMDMTWIAKRYHNVGRCRDIYEIIIKFIYHEDKCYPLRLFQLIDSIFRNIPKRNDRWPNFVGYHQYLVNKLRDICWIMFAGGSRRFQLYISSFLDG